MVKLRLKRQGRKKRPFYRVVVTDQRNRRDGSPIAELGFYDPIRKQLKLDKVTAQAWIAKGAVASETVTRLIGLASETGELVMLTQKEVKGYTAPSPAKVKEAPKEEAPEAAPEAPKAEVTAPEAEAEVVEAPKAEAVAEVAEPEAPAAIAPETEAVAEAEPAAEPTPEPVV